MKLRPGDDTLKLFFLSCAVFGVGGISAAALGVVWIYLQDDFNVTLSALGVMVSAATVGRLLTSAGSGPLINRFGIAWVMMAGVFITACSMFIFTLAPSWGVVLVVAFGSGVGAGVMATGINAFAAVHFSARRMNWLHGSYGIGSTIGPFVITTIVIDFALDWRWAYILFAVIRLILLLAFYRTRRQWRISEANAGDGAPTHSPLPQTLRLPIVWLMIATFLVATGAEVVTGQFANNFLIEARLIEPKVAGAWVSMYWASLTISRFAVGFIIARISNGMFLRLTIIGIMAGAALLWSNLSPATSLLGLALIGFAIAPFAPLMTSDTPLRVGKAHTANAIGLLFTGASLGMAFLPALAGVLAETQGLEIIPQFIFVIALITFALHEGILWRELRHPIAKVVGG